VRDAVKNTWRALLGGMPVLVVLDILNVISVDSFALHDHENRESGLLRSLAVLETSVIFILQMLLKVQIVNLCRGTIYVLTRKL
jgi:hypothetical protein